MMLPLSVVKPLAQHRLAAELDDLARDVRARHRDDLDRQRKPAEHVHELGVVGDADEFLRRCGDDLLARQRAAAAFNKVQVLGGFVRAVHVQRQAAGAVQFEHRDAVFFQALGAGDRRRHHAIELALDFDEGVDEAVGGRAGADADHPAGLDVRERGLGHGLLLFIRSHTCLATLKGGKNTLFRV